MPPKASTPQAHEAPPVPARAKRSPKAAVKYSRGLAGEIIDRLAEGERLSAIARERGYPCRQCIYAWAKRYPEFGEALVAARRLGADARADKVLDIAEAATKDSLMVDRLHIGALKWHVDRDAKAYGARADEPDLGAGRNLVIRVRRFERVVREDGTAHVQEILPSGEVIDLD